MKNNFYKSFTFHRVEKSIIPGAGLKYWFQIEFNSDERNRFLYINTLSDLSGWCFDNPYQEADIFLLVYLCIKENNEYIKNIIRTAHKKQ